MNILYVPQLAVLILTRLGRQPRGGKADGTFLCISNVFYYTNSWSTINLTLMAADSNKSAYI